MSTIAQPVDCGCHCFDHIPFSLPIE